jgi:hypothetical protein
MPLITLEALVVVVKIAASSTLPVGPVCKNSFLHELVIIRQARTIKPNIFFILRFEVY